VQNTRTFSVDHLVTPQLMVALGLFKYIEVAIGIPIGVAIGKRQLCDTNTDNCHGLPASMNMPGDQLGFSKVYVGDIPLHIKGKIIDPLATWSKRFGLAAILSAYFPIAHWAGDSAQNYFIAESNF